MDQTVQERLAANEDTFRQVNEGIARGQWPGEDAQAGQLSLRVRAARLQPADRAAAARLRARSAQHSRRFVVAPGHELPEVEAVVDRRDGYVVVEKGGEAGEFAEKLDPRS